MADQTQAHRDRRGALLTSRTTNGVDYVEVTPDQLHLKIHFVNKVMVQGKLSTTSPPVTITGGEVVNTVTVLPFDDGAWGADGGYPVLTVSVAAPGDFSMYTLTVTGAPPAATNAAPVIDPYFASVQFSFKADCPSTLDCATAAPTPVGPDQPAAPPIDYLAKDFASFRQALLDFSTLRFPDWVERSEADLGMVLVEALSALADDLSYYQDRVAAEAALGTASQAVSVLRHARLVDYEPTPATVATTVLHLGLDPAAPVPDIDGLRCTAVGADGQPVPFTVGGRLRDETPSSTLAAPVSDPLSPKWNERDGESYRLLPYWWDDSGKILPAGSTTLWVAGIDHGFRTGQRLVLHTDTRTADPPVRQLIRLGKAGDPPGLPTGFQDADHLFPAADGTGRPVTRIDFWPALTKDHDLSHSHLSGNIVDAVQGEVVEESFAIPPYPDLPPGTPRPAPVVVRVGHDSSPAAGRPDYRYTLAATAGPASATGGSAGSGLAWLATEPRTAAPDAVSSETTGDAVVAAEPDLVLTGTVPGVPGLEVEWEWRRSLLDPGAEQGARVFTLTPERYSPIAALTPWTVDGAPAPADTPPVTVFDYDGDDATTIRFGDGMFGEVPPQGAVFRVRYRVGAGAAGNVPADAVTAVTPGQPASLAVVACSNPFPVTTGADAETMAQVRDRAPQRFRAEPLRAVHAEDYVRAAQSLPWVEQGGTVFRWTGSWLAAYTTANPAGNEDPDPKQLEQLVELLDRRRLVGYPSFVFGPRYVSVDLTVTLRAAPDRFRGDVEQAVRDRLRPGRPPGGGTGFFDHSRWQFGMPLRASALAAAVQEVPGVLGVTALAYRQRGTQPNYGPLPDVLAVGADQILRMDDDPSRPEAGSLSVVIAGGK